MFVQEQKRENSIDWDIVNERRGVLRQKIEAYERVRSVYMPGLLQMLVDKAAEQVASPGGKISVDILGSSSEQTLTEDIQLWLPSEIDTSKDPLLRQRVCISGLPEMEDRLRTARCSDSLHNIQHTLRVKSRMIAFKNKNIKGQRENLRSRAVIDRVTARMRTFARRYRRDREAKKNLVGPGIWEDTLQVLHDADLTSYRDQERLRPKPGRQGANEDSWEPVIEPGLQALGGANEIGLETGIRLDDGAGIDLRTDVRLGIHEHPGRKAGEVAPRWEGTGESVKVLSWIWTLGLDTPVRDGADEGNEMLRAEWCRSRARMLRAVEEVRLTKEEMNRTLLTLAKTAELWDGREDLRSARNEELQEGLRAYAKKQAFIQRSLHTAFKTLWDQPAAKAMEEEQAEEARKLALHSETGMGDEEGSEWMDSDDGGDSEDEGLWDGEPEELNQEEEEREIEEMDAANTENSVEGSTWRMADEEWDRFVDEINEM